jgi:hypothetical protein
VSAPLPPDPAEVLTRLEELHHTWDYETHPGDCHPRREGGTWTTCCRECAGTGVFPVPWIDSPDAGRSDPDASCVACKASGRAVVGFAAVAAALGETGGGK